MCGVSWMFARSVSKVGVEMRQSVIRLAIAWAVGALLITPSAGLSPAEASSCSAVTHGTLADVVATPGLIVVADVSKIRLLGTPTVDEFAVRQVIRRGPPGQGVDLRGGMLIEPSNYCWPRLRPGDRIIAIYPFPDGLVAERAVVWRITSAGIAEEISGQAVTGVPRSAAGLIETLERLVAHMPDTATSPPAPDPSPGGNSAAVVVLVFPGVLAAMIPIHARRMERHICLLRSSSR